MLSKLLKSYDFWLVLLLTFIPSFIVFHHLGERAFWLDEADVTIALEKNYVSLFQYAIYDGHPLPYIYLLKFWSQFSGTGEFALRSFSAFFAIIFVPTIYLAAKKLFNQHVALWSAAIASTNYFLMWYGTQNKGYSFIAFFSLINSILFIRFIKNIKLKNSIWYSFAAGTGIYFHPWYIFVLVTQFAILAFLFLKTKKAELILSIIASSLLSIPGALIVLYQGDIGISSRLMTVPISTFWSAIGYLGVGSIWVYIAILGVVLFVFVNKRMLNPDKKFLIKQDVILLSVLTFLPLFLGVLVSGFRPAFEVGRYEIIVLPPFILLLGTILSLQKNKLFFASAVLLLFWLTHQQVTNDQSTIREYKSTDKTVSNYLLKNLDDNDLIIATDLSYATFYYYLKRENVNYHKYFSLMSFPEEISLHPGWKDMEKMTKEKQKYEAEAKQIVSRALHAGKNVWVLYNQQNQLNVILITELEKSYQDKTVKELPTPYMNAWYHQIIHYSNGEN